MPPEIDFTDTVVEDGVEVTTHFRRGRRGSRPFRRVSRRVPGEGSEGGDKAGLTGILPHDTAGEGTAPALRLLNEARIKGVSRISEAPFRRRLAKTVRGGTLEAVDALVRQGVVERDERLDPQGNAEASYLVLTAAGSSILESVFGPMNGGSLNELARHLQDMLAACRRPVIAEFLGRQLEAVRSGGPVCIEVGEEAPLTFISTAATPNYLKILDFFGFIGARSPDEPLEFKEISGTLYRGERDSVKLLESLRPAIAQVAEFDVGVPLDEMGIRGAHLLYWIPFCGDLRPDGHTVWGTVPAISTRDVRDARVFLTSARVVALVENRAALEHLADCGAPESGWLTICTDGMPKHALYELLSKIQPLSSGQRTYLVWTDWDLGGLRIAGKLIGWLTTQAGTSCTELVAHPGMDGRKIEVPAGFLHHSDPRIRKGAQDIVRHGAVYQEEAFSIYGLEALEGRSVKPGA